MFQIRVAFAHAEWTFQIKYPRWNDTLSMFGMELENFDAATKKYELHIMTQQTRFWISQPQLATHRVRRVYFVLRREVASFNMWRCFSVHGRSYLTVL
jgi:hypothetical protein